jgi:hypothetical protein
MEDCVILAKRNNILTLTPVGDGKYQVVEDYKDIPAGFVTDGASIPRFLWRLIDHPFQSDYIEVYVEHDHDYQTGRIPRKEADVKLRDGLARKGMGSIKRSLVYFGVRLCGSRYYNKQPKEA